MDIYFALSRAFADGTILQIEKQFAQKFLSNNLEEKIIINLGEIMVFNLELYTSLYNLYTTLGGFIRRQEYF